MNTNNEPAFPVSTRMNEDGNAFGHQDGPTTFQFPGPTLLDYFAAKAMQSLMEESQWQNELRRGWEPAAADLATTSYILAAAMLEERKKHV